MNNKYYVALATISVISASAAYGNDSEKIDRLLQLVREIKSEQSAIRADIEHLKERNARGEEPRSEARANSAETTREGGFIASIHPIERGKPGALLRELIIDGFPMNHDIAREYGIDNRSVAYLGRGELLVNEDGDYSFIIDTDTRVIGTCYFSFELKGVPIFNNIKIYHTSGQQAKKVELQKGSYKFKTYQYCNRSTKVTWNFKMVPPSSLNPVPLTSQYLFHRKQ